MSNITKGALYFLYNPLSTNKLQMKEISLDVIPDSVSHSYNANWSEQNFLGRMSPIYRYKNGTGEHYGFSVVLHEDLMTGEYKGRSIELLIDDIKSMSYPIQEFGKATYKLPRVYFQIGEISGYGIVRTNIEWNKPFRSGHYVYVTVSFDITIDESDSGISVSTIKVNNDDDSSLFSNRRVISQYTNQQIKNIVSSLSGIAQFVTDFVDPSDAEGLDAIRLGWANQQYDYAVSRLNRIYDAFASQNLDISKLDFIRQLAGRSFDESVSVVGLASDSRIKKDFNKYYKDFEKFFLEYYGDNKDITPDERDAVLAEFSALIELIKDVSREAVGYGASG